MKFYSSVYDLDEALDEKPTDEPVDKKKCQHCYRHTDQLCSRCFKRVCVICSWTTVDVVNAKREVSGEQCKTCSGRLSK